MVKIEVDIDIPKNCRECPFSKHPLGQLDISKWWKCCFIGDVSDLGGKRDRNCPLKEVEDDKT